MTRSVFGKSNNVDPPQRGGATTAVRSRGGTFYLRFVCTCNRQGDNKPKCYFRPSFLRHGSKCFTCVLTRALTTEH